MMIYVSLCQWYIVSQRCKTG